MKRKIQAVRPQQKIKVNTIDLKIGYAGCAAAEISGDAVISCGLPGGSRALILSDGMGKGIKAAAGSRLVVRRLRKNLREGMPVARAIKEVNRYMIDHAPGLGEDPQQAGEEFATVDLTIIDTAACRARFYKMGAALSFVVREGRVRRIRGDALPVGIIPALKLTHISAKLKAGDIIVVVSDGITEADRGDLEAEWLVEYLSDFAQTMTAATLISPRQLASDILEMARCRYGSREKDDLTAAVVIITDSGKDT